MDQLHLMTVFTAVAEAEGFSAAARKLRMSPPAVTRAVATLEEKLGVKLLNRTTRYVRATEPGLRYLEDCRRILQEVQTANEAAAGINAEPQGHLAITAPVLFGQKYVMPGILAYLKQYPKTQVDAIFLDRVVNLLEEGLDVGVRIGELPDSSMRALKVGQVRLMLVASPAYLADKGIPQTPQDIEQHSIIAARAANGSREWRFNCPKGSQAGATAVRIKPRLKVSTNDAAIAAAVDGFGITRLLSYQVAEQLAKGELKILLESYEPPPRPVHIVHREGRLASSKVRAFIDLLAKHLRKDKSLN